MEKYTFFSKSEETFIKVDHILGHKTNLKNLKEQKAYEVYSQVMIELIQNSITEMHQQNIPNLEIKQYIAK